MTRRKFLKMAGGSFLACTATYAVGDYYAYQMKLDRRELRLPKWDADGFRIVQVSDLHADRPRSAARARQALEMAVSLKPDALLITGDFFSNHDPLSDKSLVHALEPLQEARCPVLGILGNHDYKCGIGRLYRVIKGSNVKILCNKKAEVRGVTIAGYDDGLFGNPDPRFIDLTNVSRSMISMVHEPDYVATVPTNSSLVLAGHSHGGQICMPNGKPFYTHLGALTYYSGYYPDAPAPLFVSNGVGTVGPDIRLFCPPEINELTLRSA
ncbi:MAG: metallophosphoesterase [Armatimonadetes bacterium]|nr:metallophosphoesterase [Armatimonadota bacterium]